MVVVIENKLYAQTALIMPTPLQTLIGHIERRELGPTETVVGFVAIQPQDRTFFRRDLPNTSLEKQATYLLTLLSEMACIRLKKIQTPKRIARATYKNFQIEKVLPTLEQGNKVCPTRCKRRQKGCSAFQFLSGE
jgi:hypothetical protein